MRVLMLRPTWGESVEDWPAFFVKAKELGYDGVEISLFAAGSPGNFPLLKARLDELDLKLTVITMTSYIGFEGPRRVGPSVDDHLSEYRINVAQAATFDPLLINVQSGSQSEGSHSDCWSFEEAIDFYRRAETIDRSLGLSGRVVHETHRKRCLFHPQLTARLVKALPNLRLTGDISHWTVVCERMLDITEVDKAAMDIVIPPIVHLHTRIGASQASQCPDPTDPIYERERTFFEDVWKHVIEHRAQRGNAVTTVVLEYGRVTGLMELEGWVLTWVIAFDRPYPYQPANISTSHLDLVDSEAVRLKVLLY